MHVCCHLAEPLLQVVEPFGFLGHGLVRRVHPLHLPSRQLFQSLALVGGRLHAGRRFLGGEVVARVHEAWMMIRRYK